MHATVLCNDNASTSPQSRRVSYTAPHPHCPNTLTTHLNKKCASVMIPCTQHHFLLPLPPNSISPACLPSRPPHTTFLVTCPYMVPVATRSSHHHGLFNLHAAAFTLAFTQQHLLGHLYTSSAFSRPSLNSPYGSCDYHHTLEHSVTAPTLLDNKDQNIRTLLSI